MRIRSTVAILFGIAIASPAIAAEIVLKKIAFPATLAGTTGTSTPPTGAPLSQPIVFTFSGAPVFTKAVSTSIRITVDPANIGGQPIGAAALGEFEVDGNLVIFRPRLPSGPVPDSFSPTTDIAADSSLPGLLPDTLYRIEVPDKGPNSIKNLKGSNVPLPLNFKTKPAIAGPTLIPSLFSNAPAKAPKADKSKLKPKAGTNGISPNPFSDPANLFGSIPKDKLPPFKVRFDLALDPQTDNIASSHFRLRTLEDADGSPLDAVLASEAILTGNDFEGATVYVYPLSILPLGATIALEISDHLRSLAGTTQGDPASLETFSAIATYRVAKDPTGGKPLDDALFENFDTAARQDTSIAATDGVQLAGWDAGNSNSLQAAFGFGGTGALGRFEGPLSTITIDLDTDFQTLPLFSGATPDVAPGTIVKGGVFDFTTFHLPPNVTLRAHGSHPLVITCTGDCWIEGKIDLDGGNGTSDQTFDSAVAPMPGGSAGAGGGKGGDGHPVQLPASGQFSLMLTPQFGQSGFAPKTKSNPNPNGGGGGGGQSGATLPWPFTSNQCNDPAITGDGSRGAGGGGGSFAKFLPNVGATQTGGIGPEPNGIKVSARPGAVGIGNHLPVPFDASKPSPPEPQCYDAQPGNPTNAVARINPNPTFAEAYAQGLIYDNPNVAGLMNVAGSTWAQTKHVTLGGTAGPMVFTDSNEDNDFIGPGGELSDLRGGQGGGGGGSRTEGLSQTCKPVIFQSLGLPFTVLDARGGGGGGGGGAIKIAALGKIRFTGSKATITARGGNGGGGEQIGTGDRGGNGGGGAGGAIVLQSAVGVELNDPLNLAVYVLDVSAGAGRDGAVLSSNPNAGVPGGEQKTLQVGDGGPGAPGLIQIHVPAGTTGSIDTSKIGGDVNYSMYNMAVGTGANDGTDRFPALVPFEKTPTPLTPQSVARSTWYDLGLVTAAFRPPVPTAAGPIAGPVFGVPGTGPYFHGTDASNGFVLTDGVGNVVTPFSNDIEVDSPGLLQSDFIPQGEANAFQSVKVEFQGADESATNPGLPDLSTATAFVTDATALNGKRFIRWQITFDIATNPLVPVTPSTPRPQVNLLRIPFKY